MLVEDLPSKLSAYVFFKNLDIQEEGQIFNIPKFEFTKFNLTFTSKVKLKFWTLKLDFKISSEVKR